MSTGYFYLFYNEPLDKTLCPQNLIGITRHSPIEKLTEIQSTRDTYELFLAAKWVAIDDVTLVDIEKKCLEASAEFAKTPFGRCRDYVRASDLWSTCRENFSGDWSEVTSAALVERKTTREDPPEMKTPLVSAAEMVLEMRPVEIALPEKHINRVRMIRDIPKFEKTFVLPPKITLTFDPAVGLLTGPPTPEEASMTEFQQNREDKNDSPNISDSELLDFAEEFFAFRDPNPDEN